MRPSPALQRASAEVIRATPAAGGTVQVAPTEVMLRFSEKLEPKFSSVVVRDSSGKQVDKGDATVDKADRMVIRVLLPPLEPGVYKVVISRSRSASSRDSASGSIDGALHV
jgi:copper resistance protein C